MRVLLKRIGTDCCCSSSNDGGGLMISMFVLFITLVGVRKANLSGILNFAHLVGTTVVF